MTSKKMACAILATQPPSPVSTELNPDHTPGQDLWMTVEDLQKFLPTHPTKATIYKWTHYKEIPFYKPIGSKSLLFKRSEIERWMKGEVVQLRVRISRPKSNKRSVDVMEGTRK